ncbi:cupin domain-containing protein [Persicobacter diffluens]|uniref:DUF985 domain-containing protein n=1 Tax=Persicobacter diffluens TaxID=981 RepID=A0AAN5ALV4_9BACT|nr:hypothetical protein PEDI_37440 [Persicobacter diffluens]
MIKALIEKLDLQPHPEGGYYKELYRDEKTIEPSGFDGKRNASTAIYYLLSGSDFSSFHRIKSDEGWHYYQGNTALLVYEITTEGTLKIHRMGQNLEKDQFFSVIQAGSWFASCLENQSENQFALVGCTVAPGFDFQDFELANKTSLLEQFPEHEEIIQRLCR